MIILCCVKCSESTAFQKVKQCSLWRSACQTRKWQSIRPEVSSSRKHSTLSLKKVTVFGLMLVSGILPWSEVICTTPTCKELRLGDSSWPFNRQLRSLSSMVRSFNKLMPIHGPTTQNVHFDSIKKSSLSNSLLNRLTCLKESKCISRKTFSSKFFFFSMFLFFIVKLHLKCSSWSLSPLGTFLWSPHSFNLGLVHLTLIWRVDALLFRRTGP